MHSDRPEAPPPSPTSGREPVQRFSARALLLGQRIDLRPVSRAEPLGLSPLAISAGERGVAVLFRYGVAVLINMAPLEQSSFLETLAPLVGESLEQPEVERVDIEIDPGADDIVDGKGVIRLRNLTIERLQLVADALAKSVSLAFDEARVARAFDRIEPVARSLREQGGGKTAPSRELLRHIGDVLITRHRLVGRVEVAEKPDLLWDRPELERLYQRLAEEFELPERDRAFSRKLELISQTATTALTLIETRHSLRVEWYIVILIVIEIVLTLYELFLAPH
jgi:uncharacterized Rmd1/YagE family protein